MLAVTRAGAIVMPASPSFYGRPQRLDDAIDSVLARVLDHLGLPNALSRRWGEDVHLSRRSEEQDAAEDPSAGGREP